MSEATNIGGEGFRRRGGVGRRVAVIVVDLCLGFTDASTSLGSDLDSVIAANARICTAAREADVPVLFTTVEYDAAGEEEAVRFLTKVPALRLLKAGSKWPSIDPRLAPEANEPVVRKRFASSFFGTDLLQLIQEREIDTLIITGATTSGCVRATVVDALQHGFHVLVPREAVGDRDSDAHEANLKDIDTKYGDVVSADEAIEVIRR